MESRLAILVISAVVPCRGLAQTASSLDLNNPLNVSPQALAFESGRRPAAIEPDRQADSSDTSGAAGSKANTSEPQKQALVSRSVKWALRDQKELYLAPFQPSNIRWDLVVLGGTGGLLATDRRIERHLPGGNLGIYSNASNITIGGLSSALALMWYYGIKPTIST